MKLNLIIATTLLALATQAVPTSVKDFKGLQDEISKNNSGAGDAKLSLDADVTAGKDLEAVKKSLTISGKDAKKTIDGAKTKKGFVVGNTGTKLTLKELTLKDFKDSAVTVESGTAADITNVTFSGNSVTATATGGNGGAIVNSGTASTIANSTFSGNSANALASGTITGVNTSGMKLALEGDFKTVGGNGGAISSDAGTLKVGGKFVNNKANGRAIPTDVPGIDDNKSLTENQKDAALDLVEAEYLKSGKGGAIYNTGSSTGTVEKGTQFIGNAATNAGGAIYNAATLTVEGGALFEGNTAIAGGAIYNATKGGTLTVESGALFEGNTAFAGGAIHNATKGGTLIVNGATFKGNIAKGTEDNDGGAIYNVGTATIKNSSFVNNKAEAFDAEGGAILNEGGTLTVEDSSFIGNSAGTAGGAIANWSNGTVNIAANTKDIEFTGNTAGGKSNAIHNDSGTVNFSTTGIKEIIVNDAITGRDTMKSLLNVAGDVSFNNNVSGNDLTVKSGTLGFGDKGKFNDVKRDVTFNDGATLDLANGKISEAIVAKNVSVASGTADLNLDVDLANKKADTISAVKSSGTFNIKDLYMMSDATETETTVNVVNGLKVGDTAATDPAVEFTFTNADVYTNNYKYTVTDATKGALLFTTDLKKINGLAAALTGTAGGTERLFNLIGNYTGTESTAAELEGNLTILGNGTAANAYSISADAKKTSGLVNVAGTGTLSIEKAKIKGFTNSSTNGGVINATSGATVDVDNVLFSGNTATVAVAAGGASAGTFATDVANGKGGVIHSTEAKTTIAGTTFDSNAALDGGAIYNSGTNKDSAVTVTDSTFAKNSATATDKKGGNGGAIVNSGTKATAKIKNSTFSGNSANALVSGTIGVIIATSADNTKFPVLSGNSKTVGGNGGAIASDAGTLTVGGKFVNNKANGRAIPINVSGIDDNKSLTEDQKEAAWDLVEAECLKSGKGGAIYNTGSSTGTVEKGTQFIDNAATNAGGAIYNDSAKDFTVESGALFEGNTAIAGGAIHNAAKSGTLIVNGATFSGNIAKGTEGNSGGAIYNAGTATIKNSTFVNNKAEAFDAEGGAIYNEGGTLTVKDSSFIGNSAGTAGGAIVNGNNGTVSIVASTKDVEFTGNTAGGKSNAIHNDSGTVNFSTTGIKEIVVNDAITGGGAASLLEIDGNNVSFNNDVSGNNLRVDIGATLDFGDKGKFNDATRDVFFSSGSTLDLANGKISEAIVAKDVSVEEANNGTVNVVVDVDLATTAVDSIKAESSNQNGKFQFNNFRMLSDAASTSTAVTVFTGTDSAKPKMDVAKTTFTSNYAYGVTADNGALTFTQTKKCNGVAEALKQASTSEKTSLSLTGDYNAEENLEELTAGTLTVFGQGHTFNGNGKGGFNVTNGTLNMGDATMSGFDSALTVGTGGAATMTGVNFTGNTGAVANSGTLKFTDCSFTNNGMPAKTGKTVSILAAGGKDSAGAIYNEGNLSIVALNQDVVFGGNSASGVSNAIHNEGTSKLNLVASGHRIVFNDSITGAATSEMAINKYEGTGTIVLNAKMDDYAGTVEMNAGTLQLGANGTFFNGASALTLNGGTLDFANGHIQDHTFNKLTLVSGAEVKMHVDADLAGRKMDTLTGTASSLGGKIDVTQIRLLSDAATETLSLSFANDALKGAVKYSGSDVTYSPLFKYSAAYNDQNGMFTFTRATGSGYKSFNPDVLASPIASQVGGYLTQLATYQQAFMGMERHMLLTSNLRANVSNSAPDTMKAQFDQNDLWIRPYTTYETVELDNGPDVDNVAWGTIVGFDSRLHDLGHEFDGGLSFYAGYNGSQQKYQGKDIVQHGGVLGMTGVLYRGNFFSGLTISGGASQAKADTDYGTDDFTIMTAGIAAQTGYNWEVVKDRFIIQPGFSASYTFVKAFDYTSGSGLDVSSDPIHAIALEPGVKFIGNLDHGWQPYCGVSMVWNAVGETKVKANNIALPEMSIKPYVKGNIGVQKLFTDSLSGYLQVYGMGGGRDSIGVQLGFSGAF